MANIVLNKYELWKVKGDFDLFLVFYINIENEKKYIIVNGNKGFIFYDEKDYQGLVEEKKKGYYIKRKIYKDKKEFNDYNELMNFIHACYDDVDFQYWIKYI